MIFSKFVNWKSVIFSILFFGDFGKMKKLINITSLSNLETIKDFVGSNSTQAVNFALALVACSIRSRFPKKE